jgi:lipoprotein-anchoring transpeptidase ErfK/SrfK
MQRFIFPIVAASFLFSAPVTAQSFGDPATPARMAPRMIMAAPPPPPMRSDLGGGFIEFLFGGQQQSAPVVMAPPPTIYPPQQETHDQAEFAPADSARPNPAPSQRVERRPMDPRFLPQEVDYRTKEAPGTIVVDTPRHFLYLIEDGGRARRYGIGVARKGFSWEGVHKITAKREWPSWTPPKEMLERQPYLPRFMPGGPNNPLGARALYIGHTLYRIHGSNEPWTIGHNVSSGCIRMRNEDVIDLYKRVTVGTKVVVIGPDGSDGAVPAASAKLASTSTSSG